MTSEEPWKWKEKALTTGPLCAHVVSQEQHGSAHQLPQQESPGLAQALRKSCHLVLDTVTEELGTQVSEIDKA